MIWQEAIFTVGSIAFSIALIPTLKSKQSLVPRSSSLLTATFLSLYVVCFYTLGMYYSASTGAITATMWWLIAWLRPLKAPRDPVGVPTTDELALAEVGCVCSKEALVVAYSDPLACRCDQVGCCLVETDILDREPLGDR